jgi:hypothetical protein
MLRVVSVKLVEREGRDFFDRFLTAAGGVC